MTIIRYKEVMKHNICSFYPNCNCEGHYIWVKNKRKQNKELLK